MPGTLIGSDPWAARRRRTDELAERWPFAVDVLRFAGALFAVQERAFVAVRDDAPQSDAVCGYVAERVVPQIVEVCLASGPPALRDSVLAAFDELDLVEIVSRWLHDEELGAVQRFLARAASAPVLEALAARPDAVLGAAADERHCARCGGLPQTSYFASSPEDLVTAHRYLVCSRCASAWAYPRLCCAACGETDTQRLIVYAEIGTTQAELSGSVVRETVQRAGSTSARFPHLRIDGCATCSRYLLTVDLDRDPRAVPVVDEIGAIPLALYAGERGLTKVVPNLMGL